MTLNRRQRWKTIAGRVRESYGVRWQSESVDTALLLMGGCGVTFCLDRTREFQSGVAGGRPSRRTPYVAPLRALQLARILPESEFLVTLGIPAGEFRNRLVNSPRHDAGAPGPAFAD